VIRELKKRISDTASESGGIKTTESEQAEVEICLAVPTEAFDGLESELDEMWSYVSKKSNHRWLWHTIDHTGKFWLTCSVGKIVLVG